MPHFIPILTIILIACQGPQGEIGPTGPQGPQGPPGLFLREVTLQEARGTISSENYTQSNPDHASIPIGNPLLTEPAVLFVGIKNEHGAYYSVRFSGVIWSGEGDEEVFDKWSVDGKGGWQVAIFDETRRLLGLDYRVKFLQ